MKKIVMLFALTLAGALSLCAAPTKADLDGRIRKWTAKFDSMQQSDKRVPADKLRKAQGIILLDRTKAGFIFAYQGGGGVAMVKDSHGDWSPVALLSATEASLGLQIGGEQNFFVILLMTTNATQKLTDSIIDFGGEARGTGGDQSSGVEGDVNHEDAILIYSDRKGLYGGVSVKGGAISPDQDANEIYYGAYVTMQDILFSKKLKPTVPATELADKIKTYSAK